MKWDVLNRLEKTNYSSSKDINNLGVKIVKILEEIKELDISMEEMVTIKLMNGLGSSFETYLTMLSQKARDDNKLPDLQALLSNLEDKERRMKQTTTVNLAQSQSTSSSGREVAQAREHEVVEVVVDKVSRVEEVGVQQEVQLAQRELVDHLQVHPHQIRITLDATRATITPPPDNVHTKISNVMFVEKRDIYIGTVLGKDSWVDNKVRILRHPTC